jgi:YidC/Oxa1 family membrane protein insertase
MDRRTLVAIALCFLIFLGWQKLYLEKHAPPATAPSSPAPSTNLAPNAPQTTTKQTPAVIKETKTEAPIQTMTASVSTGVSVLGNGNRFFEGWDVKAYRSSTLPETTAIDLKSVTNKVAAGELSFDLQEFSYLTDVRGDLTKTPAGANWSYEDSNVKIVREILGSVQQPYLDLRIFIEFKTKRPNYAFVSLSAESPENDPEAQDRQLVYFTNNSIERVGVKDVKLAQVVTPVKWIGATNRYFLMTLVNSAGADAKALLQPITSAEGRVSLVYPVSGNSISIPLRAYFGPKELDLLRSVEPSLDHAVDFGWFTAFAYPLLKLMKWFYGLFHNYGVAIILLTLLVKILTYPLTYKSMKSMKEMAKLQPQLQRIREKHKDDKEALNREMLTMMKSHGYNPMSGCLPILIQMPIFFALYRVLYSSIELYQAPFLLWIHDLSAKDPYYVTPIALTLTMFIQQKLTPNTATDPAQQKMMQFMPVIFGVMMLTLPSGLTLYMLVNAIASIAQQMIMNKKLDIKHGPSAVVARNG